MNNYEEKYNPESYRKAFAEKERKAEVRRKEAEERRNFSCLMVEQYERDTVFSFGGLYRRLKTDGFGTTGNKSKISSFSYGSMRKCKLYIRNIIDHCKVSVTLTYPALYPKDGALVKRHLKRFRERLRRRGINFFWVLEFQRRGAPHFHLILDRYLDKTVLSKMWYDCCHMLDQKHLRAGTRIEIIYDKAKITNYLTSYLTKPEQKHVPADYVDVGRFWGYTKKLLKRTVHSFSAGALDLFRLIRKDRRWNERTLKSWGVKWYFRNRGFISWDHGKTRGYDEKKKEQERFTEILARWSAEQLRNLMSPAYAQGRF